MTDFPLTTTLNRIYALRPCRDSWEIGLQAAGKTAPDDEPITYVQILDAVGVQSALWVCRAEPQHGRLWRLYAVWCAKRVRRLMTDPRSISVLGVAECHANGLVADADLVIARDAAEDAVNAAAWDVAWEVARPEAWEAAWAAASAAARTTASNAAKTAVGAGALDAAWSATWNAAKSAERQAQAQAFRQLVTTGTLP